MSDIVYVRTDQGTTLKANTGIDLSTASLLQIKVLYPDESTTDAWTGSQTETTKIQYTVGAGKWSQFGYYIFQSYAVFPAGAWHGKAYKVLIKDIYAEGSSIVVQAT